MKGRHVTRKKNKEKQGGTILARDKRVIRSLSDEESAAPNGEWPQNATREDHGVSGHTFRTRASGRS